MKTNQTSKSFQRHCPAQRSCAPLQSRRRGFTLLQIVAVVGIITVLATICMTVFRQGRTTAQRAQCDVNVKTIAIALDAYRQENGRYPKDFNDLITKKYIKDKAFLHCPADPRPAGTYSDFYIPRAPRNEIKGRATEPPVLVCPFHERDGNHGIQAFTGLHTKQFATKPAILVTAGGASIERPGETAIDATDGLELHGGDRIITGPGENAVIEFFDRTRCEIGPKSNLTVLQSFVTGSNPKSPIYSLVHQTVGTVKYIVNHGSSFDVVTPAATAGALGTKFTIKVEYDGKTKLYVEEGSVYLATTNRIVLAPLGQWLNDVLSDVLSLPVLPILDGILGGLFG